MMNLLIRLAPLPCALWLSACAAGGTPQLDRRFGDAVRVAFAQQIAVPAAARHAGPAAGLDGRAARGAQERYQKSYGEAAPQQSPFVIGISGAR